MQTYTGHTHSIVVKKVQTENNI